ATAQADVLSIFGREGVDLATRWTTPETSMPAYKAILMYRNYDGLRSTFGETSVSASAPNPDEVAAFAAIRSADRKLTVMLVNKTATAPVTVTLSNFPASSAAEVWQL